MRQRWTTPTSRRLGFALPDDLHAMADGDRRVKQDNNLFHAPNGSRGRSRRQHLDGTAKTLMCSTEHTRAYLEQAEKDAALAVCQSLTVTL